jgi:UDP-glucose:(heptosyl)LPS alpha-1,3-glucosyltransferase
VKLAFCLFNFFAFGGLQRDFLRIARTAYARGHEIHVYTMRWQGAKEPGFILHLLPEQGWQQHSRRAHFAKALKVLLEQHQPDLVIGFNKMPDLDFYYAADVCYQHRINTERSIWHRLLPRYRQALAFEQAVFSPGKHTQILLISPHAQAIFTHFYQTEAERFHLLPPGLAKDRIRPAHADEIRHTLRAQYQLAASDFLLLAVGSGFKTKGLDRSILALASLAPAMQQRCHLLVIGEGNSAPFLRLAHRYGVSSRLHFLGGRSDVPDFLLAADVLLHPAYHENTGTVLLEALLAGLPVLTVAACGYADYILKAGAGMVLPEPFNQHAFNHSLQELLCKEKHKALQAQALAYAADADFFSMPERVLDLLEKDGVRPL